MTASREGREIVLYVPFGEQPETAGIAPGSAIVGCPEEDAASVSVYFEGGIYGQAGMERLRGRAAVAASRLLQGYPTVASRLVPADALVRVGAFDPSEGRITLAGHPWCESALAHWLGATALDPAELEPDAPLATTPQRVTAQGNVIDIATLRDFLKRALEDDAVVDAVNDLLFEHVVAGRFHPSVIAESLPSYISEILNAATFEDWQAVAGELIAEAREVDGEQ